MDFIIYIRRISKYLKEEHFREFEGRNIGIYGNRGIFDRFEKEIQQSVVATTRHNIQ